MAVMPARRRGLVVVAPSVCVAIVLTACGLLAPTPARFRPPLPPAEPMPGLAVEDVIDQLTQAGYECRFDPGGDISSGWNCSTGSQEGGDSFSIGIASGESGPIERLFAYRQMGHEQNPVDPEALDLAGTEAFADIVARIVPEKHLPSLEELHAGVQRNYPMELGGGWYLGFDRNMISRTFSIVYASDP
jgi:hypothetical protein